MTRYVLHPGHVISGDGDRHWVSAADLARLYRVPWRQCVVVDPNDRRTTAGFRDRPGDVHLYPSSGKGYDTLQEKSQ